MCSIVEAEDILQGSLLKQGAVRRNWKSRYFVLKRDTATGGEVNFRLVYYAKLGDKKEIGSIPIQYNTSVVTKDVQTNKEHAGHGFSLITPTRTYYLIADSDKATSKWVDVLIKVVYDLNNSLHVAPQSPRGPRDQGMQTEYCVEHYIEQISQLNNELQTKNQALKSKENALKSVTDQQQTTQALQQKVEELRQKFFISFAIGVKLSLANIGQACNVDVTNLYDEAPDDDNEWPVWLTQKMTQPQETISAHLRNSQVELP